jgi:hypothetical protein
MLACDRVDLNLTFEDQPSSLSLVVDGILRSPRFDPARKFAAAVLLLNCAVIKYDVTAIPVGISANFAQQPIVRAALKNGDAKLMTSAHSPIFLNARQENVLDTL